MSTPKHPRDDRPRAQRPGAEPTSLQPMPEPGQDAVATMLAEVLSSEAARIEPTDRLADIRTAAAAGARGPRGRRTWLPVAAGAAAVLLIGGGGWAAVEHQHQGRGTAAASPTPTPTRTPAPTPSTTTSPSTAPQVQVTVPVYYLGTEVTGLFREFRRTGVPQDTPVEAMNQAVRLALDPAAPARAGDASPWLEGTSQAAVVAFDGKAVVTVSLPTTEQESAGRTPAQARLAAQQLVWTVTAALQRPDVEVQIGFGVAGRLQATPTRSAAQPSTAGRLFGSLPTVQAFSRPAAAESFADLSPIWVLKPEPGATTGSALVVSGQACTFEASVSWQLLSRGAVVRSGHLTASSGCPVRGTWSVPLKGLKPGDYTFRAYSFSPKDGKSFEGLDTTTFTVR